MKFGRVVTIAVSTCALALSTALAAPASASERWTREEASARYLTIACAVNQVASLANEILNDDEASLRDKRRIARIAAAGFWTSSKKLDRNTHRWPENIVTLIGEQVRRNIEVSTLYSRLANATTVKRFEEIGEETKFPSNTAAQMVRLRLGLPSSMLADNGCPRATG